MKDGMPMGGGAAGGEQAAAGEGGGAGAVVELVQNVMGGMNMVGELMQKTGAPEELLGELSDVMDRFKGIVQAMAQGGEGAEQAPAPQKAKAVPLQESQGKPVGPAGV